MVAVVSCSQPAWAIRPFITDDARVVGARLVQLETWLQYEDGVLQQWVSPAFGPTDWLELTVGFTHGRRLIAHEGENVSAWEIGGPLVQGKVLLRHADANALPGVAVALGTLLPLGTSAFRAAPGFFVYAALTENLGEEERVLIHFNLGVTVRAPPEAPDLSLLAGLGTQVRLFAGLHAVAEVVFGDAFTGIDALTSQCGFRYIVNEHVQIDATVGGGLAGHPRGFWATAGLRIVSAPLW